MEARLNRFVGQMPGNPGQRPVREAFALLPAFDGAARLLTRILRNAPYRRSEATLHTRTGGQDSLHGLGAWLLRDIGVAHGAHAGCGPVHRRVQAITAADRSGVSQGL